ncbi:hypothetical protein K490DRAFT_75889 [Saccharata proteae CBS 121410]|uniref:Elongator complex protein 5 n=1 Tax=Saccharata proteae CBS 121410 TaxID=1314787 RepID=A0A9P4HR11_9PEZI|nr:hypothetical protein K490DRAFT_75889 [Saccharata proteae CBS 121410]
MPPSHLQQRRAHNTLLISKLLNGRENASPFTLIIDSLAQSGKPLVREFVRRANAAKTRVVFVSFETLRAPKGVDVFVPARRQSATMLQKEIAAQVSSSQARTLLIIDTLHPLCTLPTISLPTFLSTLLTPTTTLLSTFHSDIPLPSPPSPYSPHPLTLLKYLTTTLLTTHSLSHILAQKAARDRSIAAPVFGLAEEIEGAVTGVGSNDARGTVIEMEYRRKSGRGVREWYFLPSTAPSSTPLAVAAPTTATASSIRPKEPIILLEDHPLYRAAPADRAADLGGEDEMDTTFNLGLTEKQRREREGVVLPYFDAQRGEGPGEGGRILYDMGVEDDFDEEEDEI